MVVEVYEENKWQRPAFFYHEFWVVSARSIASWRKIHTNTQLWRSGVFCTFLLLIEPLVHSRIWTRSRKAGRKRRRYFPGPVVLSMCDWLCAVLCVSVIFWHCIMVLCRLCLKGWSYMCTGRGNRRHRGRVVRPCRHCFRPTSCRADFLRSCAPTAWQGVIFPPSCSTFHRYSTHPSFRRCLETMPPEGIYSGNLLPHCLWRMERKTPPVILFWDTIFSIKPINVWVKSGFLCAESWMQFR